jgi:ureidoglycolate hydrolase
MEEIVRVKLQPLDRETFRAYGQVLGLKSPVFPEVDEGSPVMIMARLKRAANNMRLDQMAVHFSYNQTFIPLKGSMALVVAPPPRNRDAGANNYELDYDKLAAFVLEPGDAVNIDRGTWHTAVPLGAECLLLSGTRKGAEQQPAVKAGEIEGGQIPVASDPAAKSASPYIEYVDLRKRNLVIALEL